MNFQERDDMAKKSAEDVWALIDSLVGLILFVPTILLRGWVLSVMWGWFITPALSVPVPSIAICLGLTMICPMLAGTVNIQKRKEETLIEMLLTSMFVSLLSLGLGWVIYLFV